MNRQQKIKYVIKHKIAFAKTEKLVLGSNTFRSITHDLDKLLLLLIGVNAEKTSLIHKTKAKHHNPKTFLDKIESIIDYECARYTKKDKILSAREFIYKNDKNDLKPFLNILNL